MGTALLLFSIALGFFLFLYAAGALEINQLIKVKNVFKKGEYTFFSIEYSHQRCRFNTSRTIEVDCFVNGRSQATVYDGKNKKLYNQFLEGDAAIKAYAAKNGMPSILENY